ncbi:MULTISPECIES: hemolysin III family protein [unclassified Pseudoalteromonas]|uniref:PAQR family membrane homeostasis protein TrhA n=1 Tax=unclassified Pseudoalteromonas TaxID=194690 RepID=UPI0011092C1A|nr:MULTISPECIES: hemolysin III family protein [unclassified Pseudoalteromonas]TMN84547.1 hemolysin III [Pseudoalteromonas sp. S410]TMN91236.1 hemolysin III [Pseudoalteromonas sp. S408]TMN98115.1 hemolysin III [Pseudoalteromonas sp. S407]TMO00001.1 hemolysin III [Pseudoalteromonas sp. S409]TMO11804.1 hemolysin III [Pseudoalteromonas sp. S186]
MSLDAPYSRKEEQLNVISHALGIIFAVFVMWDLFSQATNPKAYISTAIYSSTLFILFLSSTLYHASVQPRLRALYKKCDHCAIYLLIAGTYTPFLLLSLSGAWSWGTLTFIWSVAIAGVAYKILVKNGNKKISLATYLLMGWFALAIIYPLYSSVNIKALYWLLAGGVFYSAGTLFYSAKTTQFSHAIWHLFVIAGCVCHYISISNYVY